MGPRLFGIPARDSDTVAVIRRGPSGWCQVSRWEPPAHKLTPGSWLRGTIYPQRCDLSPDGRWLAYFALASGSRWDLGDSYIAISRLPWLTALAAWSMGSTWTRGAHFVDDSAINDLGVPDEGDSKPLHELYGLAATRPETFSVERRAGWHETDTTPRRSPGDAWDEQRADRVSMVKRRPGSTPASLTVRGRHAAFRSSAPDVGRPEYRLNLGGDDASLDGVQWADWARDGRLLVATVEGVLQVRDAPFGADAIVLAEDLATLAPSTGPAPEDSRHW